MTIVVLPANSAVHVFSNYLTVSRKAVIMISECTDRIVVLSNYDMNLSI